MSVLTAEPESTAWAAKVIPDLRSFLRRGRNEGKSWMGLIEPREGDRDQDNAKDFIAQLDALSTAFEKLQDHPWLSRNE